MSIRVSKKGTLAMCLLAAATAALAGCHTGSTTSLRKGFLDPTAVGRFGKQPMVVPILTSLDRNLDVTDERFRGATEVRPEDLEPADNDYSVGRNDLISVAITDLVAPNVESVRQSRVSESGMISLPLIGQVRAAGLTEAQLEREISQAYRQAQVIQNAQVSVSVLEARARTFSILGAVAAPGQYAILNSEFRLLDAMVLARDVTAQGVDSIYVIRQLNRDQGRAATQPQDQQDGGEDEDVLTPRSESDAQSVILAQVSANITSEEERIVTIDGKPVTVQPGTQPAPVAPAAPVASPEAAPTPITDSAPAAPQVQPAAPAPAPAATQEFAFSDPVADGTTRVIRIPLTALQNGDLRYNIIIKPYDLIIVPQPTIGEFYMGGHVQRSGVYSLTARKITLKQAIVSAGGFDNIAVPAQTEIIRRLPDDREIFVRVDLDKVWEGSQPDIFLRPNDIVNVGTSWWAPFVASMRGGFRLTYGFGFLYDRNWGDEDDNR